MTVWVEKIEKGFCISCSGQLKYQTSKNCYAFHSSPFIMLDFKYHRFFKPEIRVKFSFY